MKPTIVPHPRRKATPKRTLARLKPSTDLRTRIVNAPDVLAIGPKITGNRKLLPLYERLERELAALQNDEAAMERTERQTAPR
jgi:hypothetical protein